VGGGKDRGILLEFFYTATAEPVAFDVAVLNLGVITATEGSHN
jgi:hypothetical protein